MNDVPQKKKSTRRRRRGTPATKSDYRSTHRGRFGTLEISAEFDSASNSQIQTPSGYFNNLTEMISAAAGVSMTIKGSYEDVGMQPLAHDLGGAIGAVLAKALAAHLQNGRAVWSYHLDEDALARIVLKPGVFSFTFSAETVTEDLFIKKDLPFQLIEEFMRTLARSLSVSIHATLLDGRNAHRAGVALVGALADCLKQLRTT